MKIKKKECKVCGEQKFIWSRGRCKHCTNIEKGASLKKFNPKAREERSESRSCLEDFYIRHIERISATKPKCLNCGVVLLGHVSEVAHILPKSKYKSVQCDDDNVVDLCGFLQNNCHGKFDNSPKEIVASMKCFPYIVEKLELIKPRVEETIHLKILERYGR